MTIKELKEKLNDLDVSVKEYSVMPQKWCYHCKHLVILHFLRFIN